MMHGIILILLCLFLKKLDAGRYSLPLYGCAQTGILGEKIYYPFVVHNLYGIRKTPLVLVIK